MTTDPAGTAPIGLTENLSDSAIPDRPIEGSPAGGSPITDSDRPALEGRGVSVFDLDGTLTGRDTYRAYLTGYLLRHPLRWPAIPLLCLAVAAHLAKLRSNHWLKATFLSLILGGANREQINRWTARFVPWAMNRLVRAQALDRIKERQDAGDRVVIATASPDLYVPALAGAMGVADVVCTAAQWSGDGRLTGRLDGANCYGPEKRRRVEEWLAALPGHGPVTAFSDHHADLPLFDLAQNPIAVTPTPRLQSEARARHIPVELWR